MGVDRAEYATTGEELKRKMLDSIRRQREGEVARGEWFILREFNGQELATIERFVESFCTEKNLEEDEAYHVAMAVAD